MDFPKLAVDGDNNIVNEMGFRFGAFHINTTPAIKTELIRRYNAHTDMLDSLQEVVTAHSETDEARQHASLRNVFHCLDKWRGTPAEFPARQTTADFLLNARFRVSDVGDDQYTFAEMLEANAESPEVIDWLLQAKVGDRLDAYHGEPVTRLI